MSAGRYMGKTADEWELEASYYKTRYDTFGNTSDRDTYNEYMRYATNARNAGDDTTSGGGSGTTSGGGSSHDPNLITYTSGADSIINTLAGVTITALGGNDTIISSGKNVGINGGADNDRIYNGYKKNSGYITLVSSSGSYGTVDGGDGNDYIENCGSNTSISGGAGSNTIRNGVARFETGTVMGGYCSTDTIDGGTGNDSVYNSAAYSSINVGDGDDTVWNDSYGKNVTIYGGAGNDSILNAGSDSSVFGDAGNDTIRNFASNVTISGGVGNDLISLGTDASNNLIQYTSGDGDDKIYGFKYNSTLKIGDGTGTYSTTKAYNYSSTDVIVTVGDNKITLYGAGSLSKVNIQGSISSGAVVTDAGDYIENKVSGVVINTGAGNDTIKNLYGGNRVTINGGAGDDSIFNNGYNYNSAINGGSGNDTINNNADGVTISGGAGDDSIKNFYGDYVTIDLGTGNDTAFIGSWDENTVLFEYAEGDGNDLIQGFNEISTLSITSGSYSTQVSGDDILVMVGDGSITLENAYVRNNIIHINDETIELGHSNFIELSDGDDSIENYRSNVTINAGNGNDSIYNSGSTVLIDLNDGNNYVYNQRDNVTINGGNGYDTVYNDYQHGNFVSINTGAGDDSIYNDANNSVTINAGDGNDSIYNDHWWTGSNVSIDAGAGDDYIYSKRYDKSTISGDKGNDSIVLGDYSENTLIKYTVGDGNDSINGFDSDDTLDIAGSSYSTEKSGDDVIVTVGEGKITLAGAADLETVNINFTKTAWTLSDTTAKYGTADKTLVAVDGVKSLDGISLKNNVVTVSDASLNKKNVTISDDGYTLKLGSDVTKPKTSKAWSLYKTKASYKQTTSEGYTLTDNAINYSDKSVETLATIKGVKSTDGISLKKNVVTVSDVSLNKSKVTVSDDGYTLKLGKDVSKPSTTKAWNLYKTKATYKQTTTAGYTLADNAINYSNKAGETLATVKGVKSLDGISLKKKTVTISAASLNKKKVTVSDGHTLKLSKDVTKPTTSKAWSLYKTKATYKQTTTAGYTLSDNAINYSNKAGETLATVKGVKSTDGLSLKKKTVTISAASLNKKKVTISDGYTLKLSKDVTKPTTSKAWSLNKSTATYKQTTTEGYTLTDNAINYSDKSIETLATIKGVKSLDGIKAGGKKITLKNSALKSKVTVGGGYEFDFAKDYKNAMITGSSGNDSIKIFGNATVNGGKGNDSLWGSSYADEFIYSSGDGKDVIYGFGDKDTLTFNNLDFTTSYSKKNQAVTFKVDNGSITLKDFTATSFNVNGDTYKISGSKLVRK